MADDLVLRTYLGDVVKSEPQSDGSLMVWGIATGSKEDLDQQACDPEWLREAMPNWMQARGNIREQHRPDSAIGKAQQLREGQDGDWYLAAKIVDPAAIRKFKEGVYTGFSIGVKGATVKGHPKFKNGLICGGRVIEVSGVDYPAYEYSKVGTTADEVGFPVMKAVGEHQYQYAGEVVEEDGAPVEPQPRRAVIVRPGITTPEEYVKMTATDTEKAALSSAEMNDMPDSAFAFIEPGGEKDSEGKTTPRSKRHFLIHDKAHADNAAARIAQGAEFGKEALPAVKAAQKKFGEDTDDSSKAVESEANKGQPVIEQAMEVLKLASEMEPEAQQKALADLAKALHPDAEKAGSEKPFPGAAPPFKKKGDDEPPKGSGKFDPDGDGDDDSTPEGDTDHDYWNEDGTPTAKGKEAGFKAKGNDGKAVEPDTEKVGRTISAATATTLTSLAQTPGVPKEVAAALMSLAGKNDGPTFEEGTSGEDAPDTPGVEGVTHVISPKPIDLMSPVNASEHGSDGPTFADGKAATLGDYIDNRAADIAKSALEQFVTSDVFLTKLAEAGQAKVAAVEAVDTAKTAAADLTTKAQTFEERVTAQVADLKKSMQDELARIKALPQVPRAGITELPPGVRAVDRGAGASAEGSPVPELDALIGKAARGDATAQRRLREAFEKNQSRSVQADLVRATIGR